LQDLTPFYLLPVSWRFQALRFSALPYLMQSIFFWFFRARPVKRIQPSHPRHLQNNHIKRSSGGNLYSFKTTDKQDLKGKSI
jgi:hypothetical protein